MTKRRGYIRLSLLVHVLLVVPFLGDFSFAFQIGIPANLLFRSSTTIGGTKRLVAIPNEVPKSPKRKIQQKRQQQSLKLPSLKTQLYYARNGHAVLRDLLPKSKLEQLRKPIQNFCESRELSAYQQKVQVAADTDKTEESKVRAENLAKSCKTVADCRKQLCRMLRTNNVSLPFLQYFNLWKVFPEIYDLANSLAEIACILMDIQSVRLYQDAVFWKRREDGNTPWHTDARMAPFDTNHLITFWIPLHPIDSSGLVFCSKTHADVALPYWNDVSENLEERYQDYDIVDYMPMKLGDVTAHSGWTLHTADPAESSDRIALAISFVDSFAPIRADLNKGDREDSESYSSWIDNVPCETTTWNHDLVPILWPPQNRPKA